jgi:hypothetical protein
MGTGGKHNSMRNNIGVGKEESSRNVVPSELSSKAVVNLPSSF